MKLLLKSLLLRYQQARRVSDSVTAQSAVQAKTYIMSWRKVYGDKPFQVFVVFLILLKCCVSSSVSWVNLCNSDRPDADLIGV